MNKHEAIYAVAPTAVTIRGDEAFDADGNPVSYNEVDVQAYIAANAYKEQRASEYPTLADFADAYYWAQKGDNTLMDAYVAKCDAVKTKYPKD
jgi:hypothetical protein